MFDKGFFEAVKEGKPYFGHVELQGEYDWSTIHTLLNHKLDYKTNSDWKRHTIHISPSKEYLIVDCKIIADKMREIFSDHDIDSQVFANKENGLSTPSHQDIMDVFFLQLVGNITTIGKELKPGEWAWYPRGYFHEINHSGGPRISLSIGVNRLKDEPLYQKVAHLDPVNPKNYYKFEKELKNETIEK